MVFTLEKAMTTNQKKNNFLFALSIALIVISIMVVAAGVFMGRETTVGHTTGLVGVNMFVFACVLCSYAVKSLAGLVLGIGLMLPMCIIGTFFSSYLSLFLLIVGVIVLIDVAIGMIRKQPLGVLLALILAGVWS
jgi:hypothetical protein